MQSPVAPLAFLGICRLAKICKIGCMKPARPVLRVDYAMVKLQRAGFTAWLSERRTPRLRVDGHRSIAIIDGKVSRSEIDRILAKQRP